MGPIGFRRAYGKAERIGGFLMGKTNEKAQLNDFSFQRVGRGELVKRFVQGEQLIVLGDKRELDIL